LILHGFHKLTTLVLSALILAVNDMCAHCRTLKYSKRIVLFTDAESETDWSDIDIVREKVETNGIQLILVYVFGQ
jgi:hypothetical protein